MHLILQKVKRSVLFYNVSPLELNTFAHTFALKGVPDAIPLFSVIDTKKHYISKPTRHQRVYRQATVELFFTVPVVPDVLFSRLEKK
jgi:hypothetical protein